MREFRIGFSCRTPNHNTAAFGGFVTLLTDRILQLESSNYVDNSKALSDIHRANSGTFLFCHATRSSSCLTYVVELGSVYCTPKHLIFVV